MFISVTTRQPPGRSAHPTCASRCVVRVPGNIWVPFRDDLLDVPDERLGYLLARASVFDPPRRGALVGSTFDLLVRHAIIVPDGALRLQSGVRVEIDHDFCREILRTCYETGLSLIDVHTHPFSTDRVAFSGHDIDNMHATHADILDSIPQEPITIAASLVLGQQSLAGAWTDPQSRTLGPIDRFTVQDDHLESLPLT